MLGRRFYKDEERTTNLLKSDSTALLTMVTYVKASATIAVSTIVQ